MGVTIDMHVVATIFLLTAQRHPEAAMLGNPAGLDGLVNEPGYDIIESFGQKLLHGILARIILARCWNGIIALQCPPANDLRIVVEAVNDQ